MNEIRQEELIKVYWNKQQFYIDSLLKFYTNQKENLRNRWEGKAYDGEEKWWFKIEKYNGLKNLRIERYQKIRSIIKRKRTFRVSFRKKKRKRIIIN